MPKIDENYNDIYDTSMKVDEDFDELFRLNEYADPLPRSAPSEINSILDSNTLHEDEDEYTLEMIHQEIRQEVERITQQTNPEPPQRTAKKAEKPVYFVGLFSAGVSLVVIGIATIISLFTTRGIANVLKLSPIVLVILGAEILLNLYFRRGYKLRFDARSVIFSVGLIAVSCVLSSVSVATSNSDRSREVLQERYQNQLQNTLIHELKMDNLKDIKVELSLLEDDISSYTTIGDIKDTDTLNVEFYFEDPRRSLSEFAADCHSTLGFLKESGLPCQYIKFVGEDKLNVVTLELNGKFQMNLSEEQLLQMTHYFVDDYTGDLMDLAD